MSNLNHRLLQLANIGGGGVLRMWVSLRAFGGGE